MNLSKKISSIITICTQNLWFLQEFRKDFDSYTHQKGELPIESVNIPNDIKTEVGELWAEITKLLQENENKNGQPILTEFDVGNQFWIKIKLVFDFNKDYSKECVQFCKELVSNWLREILKAGMYRLFIYDMCVTHAVTTIEAFMNDFLVAIFTERPNILKSQNQATFEQILSFQSMKQLINELATTRAKNILSENIDKVANDLKIIFSIDMTTLNGFDVIREAYYRRNIIVHNKGVTDKKYCVSIPNTKIGVELRTDSQYVGDVITAAGLFIDDLDNCFSSKIRYSKDPTANRILHPEAIMSIKEIDDSSLRTIEINRGMT